MRNKPLENGISNDSFKALMLALEKAGFCFDCDISRELAEDDSIKGRVLDQIVFFSDQQIAYIKRFIADQVLLVNDIFKINCLSLTLLIITDIININKNFSAVYNFCKLKAKILFNFLFKSLDRFIFTDDIAVF